MSLLLLVAGGLLVVVIFYDAYVTTVSAVSAGGPITHRLGLLAWRGLRRLGGSPRSRILAAAGPLIVLLMLATWLGGLWAGWTMIFSAAPDAVLHEATDAPADIWARIYYAGFAVYTLGLGDYAPGGAPWQVLTAVATINGFVLLTMTVSYLIPVVMAVSERRQHGMLLHGLGDDAQHLLVLAWDDDGFAHLRPHLRELVPVVTRMTQHYLSYPVLHFFHSPSRRTALEPGLVRLDEALLLLEEGVTPEVRPHPAVLRPLRQAMERFTELVTPAFAEREDSPPPPPDLSPLRAAGIPTRTDRELVDAVADRAEHRRRLAGFVTDACWSWTDGVEVVDQAAGDAEGGR